MYLFFFGPWEAEATLGIKSKVKSCFADSDIVGWRGIDKHNMHLYHMK